MYRLQDIINSFKTLVGWEQGRSNEFKIDAGVTASDSGLYFQDAHPLLTLRAMKSIMPQDWMEQYPIYSSTETYSKDAKVVSSSKVYKSLVNSNIGHSVSDTTYWVEYNILSDYLESLRDRGIKKAIQRFVRDKMINLETQGVVEKRCVFDGAGRLDARIPRQGRICGFEITPLRAQGITMRLEKLGLQFVGNTGQVVVYLFHSSKAEPVATKTLTYSATNGTFQWFDLGELFLPYLSSELNAGGSWYLVYNEASLPAYMESINFARDWSREPCSTCNKGDVNLYRTMTKYVDVSPFYVDGTNWNGKLWDIRDNVYTSGYNYGMNFQFSLLCDLTDSFLSMRNEFANVIQLQVAVDSLRTLALNPEVEVNRVQYNADRDNIMYETDGNGQGIKGLSGDLDKAYKALSVDLSGIDKVCLGCHNKGIRFGSI